ncbi:Fe2+-dependent dioxygenase [Parvibaculum sp.]|jgi:PKHD-type hydroxylase|uniref:Fe2+-dependent dioxygenase n=1 Tax=Parvibaculum sp. TaxID=2024848 RepID=UPI000C5DB7BD|nr:Fe2+-dependent dioxygenase [Parvibaculum sp.]MAM95050.1 Fe2+-dependent dioxygenase [Parvibaculum sp.]HCX69230.1 Fe2+-dependent dioxygenase [Rhodobiaceae bacterium]|tara:strand:- start:737 stop:1417 length:681 start_codon:yes stop_codon:yes gene_type:complete
MMITIPDFLTTDQLRRCREALEKADWQDGRETAGDLAVRVKANKQLAPADPLVRELGDLILDCLGKNDRFLAAALPLKVLPPRFNRYEDGGTYGNHVDNAIFSVPGTPHRIRSDVSATLFFSEPDEYEGGELVIQDTYGSHTVKLPAGHMVLYPGTSLHRVTPVTKGVRLASFFWVQSLVREDSRRALLWELDRALGDVRRDNPESEAAPKLMAVYHNLLREWSNT